MRLGGKGCRTIKRGVHYTDLRQARILEASLFQTRKDELFSSIMSKRSVQIGVGEVGIIFPGGPPPTVGTTS